MEYLSNVSLSQLQQALDEVEGSKATQRLTAAIAYKHGISQTELAEWYGVQRRTIYRWLTELDEGPVLDAVVDDDRPGRPRKLSDMQWKQLRVTLRDPPTEVGYDDPWWTPTLLQRHLDRRFEVEYSLPSCRRLLKEAGLRYQTPSNSEIARRDSDVSDFATRRWVPQ